ncbi:hypothetical protein TB1_002300 [Malus domestica]
MQIHGRIYVVPRPSGFVHQHLAPSVGNDTKNHVGSLSNFHLHRESAKSARTQNVTPSKVCHDCCSLERNINNTGRV